jgi:hypothetical protein
MMRFSGLGIRGACPTSAGMMRFSGLGIRGACPTSAGMMRFSGLGIRGACPTSAGISSISGFLVTGIGAHVRDDYITLGYFLWYPTVRLLVKIPD